MVRAGYIRPDMLKEAIERSKLHKLLQKFDEIDIPTDTGEIITVVCGLVKPDTARFVFKDCWDTEVMYDENTNEGGYYRSKGRRHVLEDIWPRIDPAWQEIIKPRLLVEEIDGVEVRYDDSLWLPSATDVFGPPKGRWWKEEPDSDQLPIFIRERGRVKECADRGTYPWQLRSILASDVPVFCSVGADGIATSYSAYGPLGFAPGFDI
jgi:hypothetical protein